LFVYAEKMRDMTQTTDYRHDQCKTALFFCREGKNEVKNEFYHHF
jgi:hypothetical protein